MALKIAQQNKRQKILILIFVAIVLITIGIWYFGYYSKDKGPDLSSSPKVFLKDIKINLELLESPAMKRLQSFQEINEFRGRAGRSNPFLPYSY